jgi:hypothetical protein
VRLVVLVVPVVLLGVFGGKLPFVVLVDQVVLVVAVVPVVLFGVLGGRFPFVVL